MAIDPSATYAGQIDTTDPVGYPYGKARNELVEDDGTGTPWEQDIVNDLLGFQQALLDYHGVAPSGVPEKVGTSQYLDALTDSDWVLTGDIRFNGAVHFTAAPAYVAGIARTSWAAMNGAWAQGGDAPSFNNTQDVAPDVTSFVAGTTRTCINFRIPPGATLTGVTGVVFHGGAYNCTMRVVRRINALTGSARGAVGAQVTITAQSGVQTIPTATLASVANEVNEYWAEFEFSNSNSSVQGVQVSWTDPGIQNQLR